ncbi:hypothetical protein GIB67_018390 [Kingdonia uniflora]|uniref:SBP-type domain-containing protein n=1 Tax=Kingdonia uniflora TaxID=39325 RepID=A0A7J7MJ82_9MAGN|nr:hypothetical protein GIB67_018390 [Kingdonia uniflora]
MKARVESEGYRVYEHGVGKKSLDWNLDDWKWDGDHFIASCSNFVPSPLSDEINLISNGKELEKRERVGSIEHDETENLSLKLGGHVIPNMENGVGNWDKSNGKKMKVLEGTRSRGLCQVDDCGAVLQNAKDYHRRHKVCEVHSKAVNALVGSVMQRFCQQCSRFHLLQEFDDGKRSCRRRLSGHNKRRRKANPDVVMNENSLDIDQATSYLLTSLLRVLSSLHSSNSDHENGEEFLSHLLRNLPSLSGSFDETSLKALFSNSCQSSSVMGSISTLNVPTDAQDSQMCLIHPFVEVASSKMRREANIANNACGVSPKPLTSFPVGDVVEGEVKVDNSTVGRVKCCIFDLNKIYDDSQECMRGFHQSSPLQINGNSDSALALSQPSRSTGDAQGRTDRIVFKLFGKDPNDFPLLLRVQILDWLSQSPIDIESYIRPGCIILTIYVRLAEFMWEELCYDLSSSLSRLLEFSTDPFWRTGWVYIRVQDQIALIYDGRVILDMSLPFRIHTDCKISSITPVAVCPTERAQFLVKGLNLSQPTTRLLCELEGKYLPQEATHHLLEDTDSLDTNHKLQCLGFTCSIPDSTGRGFIEVEDYSLGNSFFPFIVAEEDMCSEIRMLENAIETSESDDDIIEATRKAEDKKQALDFIHEMGWLLHRSNLRSRSSGHMDLNTDTLFPFTRFKELMEFSMDRSWRVVVKKLLDIIFEGTVDTCQHSSIELALSEMGLIHKAIRRSSRVLLELLLKYIPYQSLIKFPQREYSYLFRPDAASPAGLTPLHVAASGVGCYDILDALTDDPGLVGIVAWKSARDNRGFTPEDYARIEGHHSYIHLVQKKIDKKQKFEDLILDIPDVLSDSIVSQKQITGLQYSDKHFTFEINKIEPRQNCRLCERQQLMMSYGHSRRYSAYRPAVLSMVTIAAVCVCLGLFFKSSPAVLPEFGPFRWELLSFGSI